MMWVVVNRHEFSHDCPDAVTLIIKLTAKFSIPATASEVFGLWPMWIVSLSFCVVILYFGLPVVLDSCAVNVWGSFFRSYISGFALVSVFFHWASFMSRLWCLNLRSCNSPELHIWLSVAWHLDFLVDSTEQEISGVNEAAFSLFKPPQPLWHPVWYLCIKTELKFSQPHNVIANLVTCECS